MGSRRSECSHSLTCDLFTCSMTVKNTEMITKHQNTNTNLTPNTVHRIFIRIYTSIFFLLFSFLLLRHSHHHVSFTSAGPPLPKFSSTTVFSDQLQRRARPSFLFCKSPSTIISEHRLTNH